MREDWTEHVARGIYRRLHEGCRLCRRFEGRRNRDEGLSFENFEIIDWSGGYTQDSFWVCATCVEAIYGAIWKQVTGDAHGRIHPDLRSLIAAFISDRADLYFACLLDDYPHPRRIKIGFSTRLVHRMTALKARPVLVMEGEGDRERLHHLRFEHLREDGEWFRNEGDLREFLIEKGADLGP